MQSTASFVDALYRRYWLELCQFISRRYGPGPPEPEDVVQTAFAQVAALEHPEKLANPRAFLYRVAHNVLVDQRRRIALQDKVAAEAETQEAIAPGYDLPAERVLIGKEGYKIIEDTILRMPARRRQCFLLHRLHGLSYAEIARRLGLSGPAVFKAVEKALAECQRAMEAAQHARETDKEEWRQ